MSEPMAEQITIRDKYGPAMEITDQVEADAYFERCVAHTLGFDEHMTRTEAERIERINLGYYAGYYDSATMEQVNRLFHTTHPVFGSTTPTTEQALEAGFVGQAAVPR